MTARSSIIKCAAIVLATFSLGLRAEEPAPSEMAVLRNTVVSLLEAMVRQGLISKEAAEKLVADAQSNARKEAVANAGADPASPGDVRVTYVPKVVQDQITAQVREDVKAGLVDEVKKSAAAEGWGVPAALPAWVRNSRWSGDIRVRGEYTAYGDGNEVGVYKNFQVINDKGGEGKAGADALLNVTEDQVRFQIKMGFGGQFDLAPNATAAVRFGTGSQLNPVTRNQALGNWDRTFPLLLEEAYLRFSTDPEAANHRLLFWAGRTPNPFQSTELVWDTDVRFNGFTAQYAWNNPDVGGPARMARGLYVTTGAYPIQEVELAHDDKWLLAGQLGYEFDITPDVRLSLAAAYYDYRNIEGRTNVADGDTRFDYTAPAYLQKGNTVFDIRNDTNADTNLYALAADYNLVDLTAVATWTLRPDLVLDVTGDYVANVGYNYGDVLQRVGGCQVITNPVPGGPAEICPVKKTTGYRLEARIGNREIARPLAWRASMAYHYAERDAVLDAFTDSDFHRGGTDATGFIIGGELGITNNTWLRLRYLSADEIDGPPLSIDVLQLDINGRF